MTPEPEQVEFAASYSISGTLVLHTMPACCYHNLTCLLPACLLRLHPPASLKTHACLPACCDCTPLPH